ncbi:pseudouridine synthase [Bryobacterales bacterium F-183]|nr:pseudouridine synthase [Bryobacterales bacterium F-183]
MSFRYILFHKPYGVVSQFSGDDHCLRDFIPIKDVYPVGRLDKDSEGLMLLTSDGALQHRLSDPKFEHPRTYWAQVDRIPSPDALKALQTGVIITDGYKTRPAKAKIIDEPASVPPRDPPVRFRLNVPTAWIELTLTEGRNRQVRHMTAAIGHPTLRLIRVAIGKIKVDGLTAGQWRNVTPEELRYLRNIR